MIGIEPAIDDQRAQRRGEIAPRGSELVHDAFENLFRSDTLFSAGEYRVGGVQPDDVLDILFDPLRFGAR
jgi:hypothetical protein